MISWDRSLNCGSGRRGLLDLIRLGRYHKHPLGGTKWVFRSYKETKWVTSVKGAPNHGVRVSWLEVVWPLEVQMIPYSGWWLLQWIHKPKHSSKNKPKHQTTHMSKWQRGIHHPKEQMQPWFWWFIVASFCRKSSCGSLLLWPPI